MYVPDWPPLNPARLVAPGRRHAAPPFPLNAPHRTYSYVARNVIYHLFRALGLGPDDEVLMPEYHSGVEVWAVRAAGARVTFYPVNRRLEPDLDAIRRRSATGRVRVLYAVHFIGFPQPIADMQAICREHDLVFLEDCALALFSQPGGVPLGSTGDYAVYCLYKTLPLPHGGLLVQNHRVIEALDHLPLTPCSTSSIAGRTSQLTLDWIRGRSDMVGKTLVGMKRGLGRLMTARGVTRVPVGDISPEFSGTGFGLDKMNLGMSPLCHRLLDGTDCDAVRARRRANFLYLRDRLAGHVAMLRDDLEDGVCPLFLPLLVADKHRVTDALLARGIGAVEFWNYGHPEAAAIASADTRFLRTHVIELPIHQDISQRQLDYVADQVIQTCRLAA